MRLSLQYKKDSKVFGWRRNAKQVSNCKPGSHEVHRATTALLSINKKGKKKKKTTGNSALNCISLLTEAEVRFSPWSTDEPTENLTSLMMKY